MGKLLHDNPTNMRCGCILATVVFLLMVHVPLLAQDTEPLPSNLKPITPENVNELAYLGRLGRGFVMDIAYTPDGVEFAAAGPLGIWFYDAHDPEAAPRLLEVPSGVARMAFNPDGTTVATVNYLDSDFAIHILDILSGEVVSVLEGHTAPVTDVAFSPDGVFVASVSKDNTVRLWDAKTGDVQHTLKNGPAIEEDIDIEATGVIYDAESIVFSPDGKSLAATGVDGVRVWDVETGQEIAVLHSVANWVNALVFSPDGTVLAGGGKRFWGGTQINKTIELWDSQTGKVLTVFEPPQNASRRATMSLAFSPDGTLLAAGNDAETIELWNTADLLNLNQDSSDVSIEAQTVLKSEYAFLVWGTAFSPDGTTIAMASLTGPVRLWDVNTGQEKGVLQEHADWGIGAALSPDGRTLAVQSLTSTNTHLWDMPTQTLLRVLPSSKGPVAFNPDGAVLTSSIKSANIMAWNVKTGESNVVKHYQSWGQLYDFASSPDGSMVAAVGQTDAIRIWDALTMEDLAQFDTGMRTVSSVAFSPDSTMVVAGGKTEEGTFQLWDVATGEQVLAIQGCAGSMKSVAFSPDGNHIASGCEDGTANLWDAQSGEKRAVFENHPGVSNVAFSPDGRLLAVASDTVQLWDVETAEQVAAIGKLQPELAALTFSLDGTLLLFDRWGSLEIWGVPGD